MKISALRASPFAPFGEFEIEFPHVEDSDAQELAEVHVITGPNGSGKTRLLALISACLGADKELAKRVGDNRLENFSAVTFQDTNHAPERWWDVRNSRQQRFPAMSFCPRAYLETAEVRANAEIREPSIEEALSFSRTMDESSRQLQGIYTMDLQGATETSAGLPGRYSKMIKTIESAIQTVTGRLFKFV